MGIVSLSVFLPVPLLVAAINKAKMLNTMPISGGRSRRMPDRR